MSLRYFARQVEKAAIIDTKANKVCLPVRINCDMPEDDLVVNDGQEFNCSRCCDTSDKYYLPLMVDDVFDIQTNFKDMYNPDPENPINGFGVWINISVIDLETGLTNNINNTIDSYYVGWDGSKSYQVIRLKITANTPKCFKIKYVVNKSDNTVIGTYSTQHFRVDPKCINTIEFENKHKGTDCEGNYYGMPINSVGDIPFTYSNKIRLKVDKENGTPIRETYSRNGLTQKKLIKYLQEYHFYYVPLYVIKYINNKLDQNDKMLIDGKLYNIELSDIEKVNDCFYNLHISVISLCNEKC